MKSQPASENQGITSLQSRSKRSCTKSTSYFPAQPKVLVDKTRPIKIRTFKFFPKLPLEIRNQIWSYTLPGPRLLNLQIHLKNKPRIYGCFYRGDGELVSISFNYIEIGGPSELLTLNIGSCTDGMSLGTMPHEKAGLPLGPPALLVNRESRDVALREGYELAFAGKHGRPELKTAQKWAAFGFAEKRIWINFSRDVLFLEDELLVTRRWRYAPEEIEKVKRMGFLLKLRSWKAGESWLPIMKNFFRALLPLKGLEEVFLWDSTTEDIVEADVDDNSTARQLEVIQIEMEELWKELLDNPERSGQKIPVLRVMKGSEWI